MIKRIIFASILVFVCMNTIKAETGDTVEVRTIEFQEERIGWFQFPDSTETFEKILMNYKLKCPEGKPCGEWDYIANVFVDHYFVPSFRVNGKIMETANLLYSPTYSYTVDTTENGRMIIDSTADDPVRVYYYDHKSQSTEIADSNENDVWLEKKQYLTDAEGFIVDSVSTHDTTLILEKTRVWFRDDVTVRERYEIYRYITPYGFGVDLGDGFTWKMDLSDFAPLLKGKVFIYAPHGQNWTNPTGQNVMEDLELTFDFIEGEPARDIIRFQKMWEGGPTYNAQFEDHVPPIEVEFDENEKNVRFKMIQTGHGFGSTEDNCAEFCRKEAYLKIDGEQKFSQYIWRECGDVPLYPQGGNWVSDRTNWCPGASVYPDNYELTEFITPGATHSIDYDMEYFDQPWDGSRPWWKLASYLITYGEPNRRNDAELTEILAPSEKKIFNRYNPRNIHPVLKITNKGSEVLTSVEIEYGQPGKEKATYTWSGQLGFEESENVVLSDFVYDDEFDNIFTVELKEPNGVNDEYPSNNDGKSVISGVPDHYENITINMRTNNYDIFNIKPPYKLVIKNQNGEEFLRMEDFENSTKYVEELNLPEGHYTLRIDNTEGFGLGYWLLAQQYGLKEGYLRILTRGKLMKDFPSDFGNYIYYQFKTGPKPTIMTSAAEDKLDFGVVKIEEDTVLTLKIFPENKAGLKVNKFDIVFGSIKKYEILETRPEIIDDGAELQEGDTMEVDILFEPQKSGNIESSLSIFTNDAIEPAKKITLTGYGDDGSGIKNNGEDATIKFHLTDNPVEDNSEIIVSIFDIIPGTARMSIYNSLGEKVKAIYSGRINGTRSFDFDPQNLSPGIYYLNLTYKQRSQTLPVIIMK